jgi:hypothetical protein
LGWYFGLKFKNCENTHWTNIYKMGKLNRIKLILSGENDMSQDGSTHTCACGGSCGCQDNEQSQQVYLTPEQYTVRLEQYLVELKAEIAAVEQELIKIKAPVAMVSV